MANLLVQVFLMSSFNFLTASLKITFLLYFGRNGPKMEMFFFLGKKKKRKEGCKWPPHFFIPEWQIKSEHGESWLRIAEMQNVLQVE